MVALKTLTVVTKSILKTRSGGGLHGHLPEHLLELGLGLHPSLVLWLAYHPSRGHGVHLPDLAVGMVHAPHLLGLGGHLPELDHGGRGQQCWTDWAWVCIAG